MPTSVSCYPESVPAGSRAGLVWTLVAVLAANAMDVVAAAVQTVAAPEMAGALSASVDEAAWLNVLYLSCKMAGFVLAARHVAAVGHPAALRHHVMVLLVAALCLLWPDTPLELAYAGRALQGLGGAGVMVAGLAWLLQCMPSRLHAWAQAAFSSTTMLGPSLCNDVSGQLIDAVNWQAGMAVAVPCGLLALVAVRRAAQVALRPLPPQELAALPRANDGPTLAAPLLLQLLLWCAGAAALQFAAARGTRYNWGDVAWLPWLVLLGAAGSACFVALQARGRPGTTWLPLTPLGDKTFRFACMTSTLSAYGAAASAMLLPLLMRHLYGWAAADVGQSHLPSALACGLGLLTSALSTARRWCAPLTLMGAGLALVALALGLFCILTPQADVRFLTTVLCLRGLAFGLLSVPTAAVAFANLRDLALVRAVAIYQTVRQLGTTLASVSMLWRLAETQARFGYQFRLHLSPIDPTTGLRLSAGAARLVARGVSPAAGTGAGVADVMLAMAAEVEVLSYRACCQEVLLVFGGGMVLALLLRRHLVPAT